MVFDAQLGILNCVPLPCEIILELAFSLKKPILKSSKYRICTSLSGKRTLSQHDLGQVPTSGFECPFLRTESLLQSLSFLRVLTVMNHDGLAEFSNIGGFWGLGACFSSLVAM
jgi:hypothetical protein